MTTLSISGPHAYALSWIELIGERLALQGGDSPTSNTLRALDARENDLRIRAREYAADIPMFLAAQRLALTATEERALWLLIAHEMDAEVRELVRGLNTEEVSDVSLSTLRRVVHGDGARPLAWKELAVDGSLRRLGLIDRTDGSGNAAEYRQTFSASSRSVSLAHGAHAIDPMLDGIAIQSCGDMRAAPLVMSDTVRARISLAVRSQDLVVLTGQLGSGRRTTLLSLAEDAGLEVVVVDAGLLAADATVARRQLRAVARDARIYNLVPLIKDIELLSSEAPQNDRLGIVDEEFQRLVLATSARPLARRWRRVPQMIELPPLDRKQCAAVWLRSIPEGTEDDADRLATMYPLTPSLVIAAGHAARKHAAGDPLEARHVQEGVASVLDHKLGGLAKRISVSQSWSDLVLPAEQSAALAELIARIRQRRVVFEDWGFAKKLSRGLGVAALFSGPPGTGKTMAAGLIAAELRVPLYQVDLSRIVSKYLGETEKNLAALFDAAEAGNAILLFDEADSLFGKRTEVRSSNDRYANQETNYLLQRMESYGGVSILTTNHDSAIDDAFRRRLAIHVRFPLPEAAERRDLWRALIPPRAPVASRIEFEHLAQKFEMSGGYIRNAVLRAAFLAAETGGVLDEALLQHAATLEYEAMGKVVASAPAHSL
jgi:hypothetical protein